MAMQEENSRKMLKQRNKSKPIEDFNRHNMVKGQYIWCINRSRNCKRPYFWLYLTFGNFRR